MGQGEILCGISYFGTAEINYSQSFTLRRLCEFISSAPGIFNVAYTNVRALYHPSVSVIYCKFPRTVSKPFGVDGVAVI